MPTSGRPDPVRATLVAILQQLNRIESMHEGRVPDQALELTDLDRLLHRFWAVEEDRVKVPLALGLLVRNGLVEAQGGGGFGARAKTPPRVRYRITAEGKRFLIESVSKTDRIS